MHSFISFLLLSGCFPTATDSVAPIPSAELPADAALDADAKRCTNHYFRDADGDGYGNSRKMMTGCIKPPGFVSKTGDCDDRDASRNPAAVEVCDGVDQDCDRLVDEQAIDASSWYADADGDGHGNPAEVGQSCSQPAGYAAVGDDCDDTEATIYEGAPEVCDGIDNNCNSAIDDAPVDGIAVYPDADGDGYGLEADPVMVCLIATGFADKMGDCDDTNHDIFPNAPEVCDGADQNCDGQIDENAADAQMRYPDDDGDMHGDPTRGMRSCASLSGQVLSGDDCNDLNAAIFPGAAEVCDGADQDCNGQIDDNAMDGIVSFIDQDGDGFGDATKSIHDCSVPKGYIRNSLDCDDSTSTLPFYVDLGGMRGASGTLADPASTIQEGVDAGAACIVVGSGTFQEDLDLSGFQGSIQSVNGAWDTTLTGLGVGPVVKMEGSRVRLVGLTITGGGAGDWAFTDNDDSSCTGIQQSMGGGLWISASIASLDDVVVTDNDILGGTSPRPECNSLVESMGGGIYAEKSTLELNEVQLTDNAAVMGAAMTLEGSTVTATRLRVTGAPVGYDSDILVDGGSLEATNVLLAGPASTGLSTQNSVTTLDHALVGGYATAGWRATDSATVKNSIFLDNGTAMDGAATWTVDYTDSYNNGSNWPATIGIGDMSVEPQLMDWSNDGDAGNDNFVLAATSPLIDAGTGQDKDGSLADIGPMGGESGW